MEKLKFWLRQFDEPDEQHALAVNLVSSLAMAIMVFGTMFYLIATY